MGAYISRYTSAVNSRNGDDVTDAPVKVKAKVVEHVVARYDEVDNPETHMPSPKKITEFNLEPKYERSKFCVQKYRLLATYLQSHLNVWDS